MVRLFAVQAAFGDCLLLVFGEASAPKYILFDGGPGGTYEKHLHPVLKKLSKTARELELVILTHVDNDHAIGLLDLFADLRRLQENGRAIKPQVCKLWHNTFEQTVDPGGTIAPRLRSLLSAFQTAGMEMANTGATLEGIQEGHQLRLAALALGVPLNPDFPSGLITLDQAPTIAIDELEVQILAPSQKSLKKLRKKWLDWLAENEARIGSTGPQEAIKADTSIPNLSSIMTLITVEGKRLLMTGDGLGSELIEGLKERGCLGASGSLHVDLLKLPHHGSARNVSEEFFQTITANTYVISADGKYGNPDLATLHWLVENVPEQHRPFEIVVTNRTDATRQLLKDYPPKKHGYTLKALPSRWHSIAIDL